MQTNNMLQGYMVLFIYLVEGLWSAWDPWGTCYGICDSDAERNRTRRFSNGTMPCNENATEVESCSGTLF